MKAKHPAPKPESAAKQCADFIGKFDPKVAKVLRECRAALRKRLPTAVEIVYDNYNFLVFGFCSTERPSDCIASVIANAKGVGLSFYYGATLPDPHGLLQGSGSQNRFVRLVDGAATLADPRVGALIDAAIAQGKHPLPKSGKGYTIVKSISKKQRPRKAASA
jgi:Domain of unknown function (DU1801)